MNTVGIKEYTCPKCKKPFTRLERSTFSVVLGVVIIFFSIPGILFGIFIFWAPDGSEIAKWIFLIAPTLFALYGLNCMRGKLCPNCGSKVDYMHIKLPIIGEIQNKLEKIELGTRLFGLIFFTMGLFIIGFGLWLILTSGEFQALILVAIGILFVLFGLSAIFRPESFIADTSGLG